ncbi:MAG TPA: hypothetical protein VFD46_08095 [Chryseolinea sp.]|nr:hypothetical protein [Chryseolinea sp.]
MWFQNFNPLSLIRQPATSGQINKQSNYILYGENDAFPLKLSKAVEESPATSACISTLADFIEGDGFSVPEVGKIIVNKRGETFDDIHCQISTSFATYEGFALNVKYSILGKITELRVMSFENCRLSVPDAAGNISKIHYNPYYGTGDYRIQQTVIYDAYDPDPAVVQYQIKRDKNKYKGQIYYVGTTKALHRFYPQPEYYSAKFWMSVDSLIGSYWFNNLENGFLQSVIFKLIGDPSLPSKNPRYQDANGNSTKTVGEEFSDMMSERFSGAERVGNIMTWWAANKEEFPEVQAFPSDAKADVFTSVQKATIQNITISTKVPAILANISEGVSLGSDGNTILAAVKLMQQRVVKKHHYLERIYTQLFSNWKDPVNYEISILHYSLYESDNTVDDNIWQEMTSEERRNWIKKNTNIELVDIVQTQQAQNFKDVSYSNYPQGARDNAKRALSHQDTAKVKCGTKMGWDIAKTLVDGTPITYKMIKRIKNFLNTHEGVKNNSFSDNCDTVLYHAWGGKEMQDWVNEKVKEVEL